MANPIKASDLYADDGAIDKLIKQLKEVNEQYQKLMVQIQKDAEAAAVGLNRVNASTTTQREEIVKTSKKADELSRAYDAYTAAMDENRIKIEALKNSTQQLNTVNKLEARLRASKEGSYNALSAQYGLNKIRLNQLTDAERKAGTEGAKLEKQTDAIYTQMKKLQEATGKHVLSVGDYGKATEGLVGKLQQVPGPAALAGSALEGLGTALRFFVTNPIVAILALIAGGLYAIGKAFGETEHGARLMSRVTGTMNALWLTTIRIANDLAGAIEKAFTDPKAAMADFSAAFKTQIRDQFIGFNNVLASTARTIGNVLVGDMKSAKTASDDLGKSFVQMITGLDPEKQAQAAAAMKKQAQELAALADALTKLDMAKLDSKRRNRELEKSLQAVITMQTIADGDSNERTISFAEQEKAQDRALKAAQTRASIEIKIAKNNLSLLTQEIAIRQSHGQMVEDLLDQELDAYKSLSEAERQYAIALDNNEDARALTKQKRIKEDIDAVTKGFATRKKLNDDQLKDETLTFEHRRNILQETEKLANDTFVQQIEAVQKFTELQINGAELVGISDARILQQRVRGFGLSMAMEGELIDIITKRQEINQDLIGSAKELANAEIKAAELAKKAAADRLKAQIQLETEGVTQRQALRQSEFDLLKSTEAEKKIFSLNAEKDRLEALIEINARLGGDLNEIQLQTMRNGIKKIDAEISKLSDRGSIWEALGIDEDGVTALKEAFASATSAVKEWAQERLDLSNTLVENSKTEVEQAQAALIAEQENVRLGVAANITGAQQQLDAAKKNQAKALEEQRRAQQQQILLQSVEQASNLITASTKIWAALGFPLAIPALGVLWGTFAASKIKALQLTQKQFGSGGVEELNYGGSHASGNDIHIGMGSDGSDLRAERGETLAVFNRANARKYRNAIPELVGDINAGIFERKWQRLGQDHNEIVSLNFYGSTGTDTKTMERELRLIRKQGRDSITTTQDGRVIIRRGNKTVTYV